MKETPVQQRICLSAAYSGIDLWRNNNGACYDQTGRLIRYGLANESKKMNKSIKSSDLIGITPVIITQDMVGQVVGVFTAVETKKSDWVFNNADERTIAQLNFINIVKKHGGYGGFARSVDEFNEIVKRK